MHRSDTRSNNIDFDSFQDLTRNEKIQMAKQMTRENKFAMDAWAILIQEAQVR